MPLVSPTLTIHLSAIAENYRRLKSQFTGKECAAVVKADAYGLGADKIALLLHQQGCNLFFVATLEEAVRLRQLLPKADIGVFHGPYAGEEKDYLTHQLMPVLNHPTQVERWLKAAKDTKAPAALHVDTGMCRLGLSQTELEQLMIKDPLLVPLHFSMLISHLACAGDPEHPKNAEQLLRLRQASALLPNVPVSFCNSSGIFLDDSFHFDIARPGCALYGITPNHHLPNPMMPVVTLTAPILEIRTLDRDETIGYGALREAAKGSRIAIVQAGYADGILRSATNKMQTMIGTKTVSEIGRVSMDMIALDVSTLSEAELENATQVELLNDSITVDHLAEAAGTIGYEIFTRLGARVKRVYR